MVNLEWVIMADLPFTFVENDLTRKFSKLGVLSRSTFMKYLQGVTKEVEMIIKKQLPSKFGLIFDGWTDSSTSTHFLPSNSVSKFQEFERALLKKQEGKELCDLEQSFIRSFYVEETMEGRSPYTESVSFADRILASKRPKLELSLKWIPATSNIAEQLFSSARHIFSDNRKNMTPVTLEAILFLKANKKLWDAQVVKQATEKISEDQ